MSELRIADLAFLDRNPKIVYDSYRGLDVSPEANKERFVYQVPEDRMCLIEVLQCTVLRVTAGDAGGLAEASFLLGAGATIQYLLLSQIRLNTVAEKASNLQGAPIMLYEDDLLTAETHDNTTNGTCNFILTLKGTEFDAITQLHRVPPIEPSKRDLQNPTEERPWWKQILGWP